MAYNTAINTITMRHASFFKGILRDVDVGEASVVAEEEIEAFIACTLPWYDTFTFFSVYAIRAAGIPEPFVTVNDSVASPVGESALLIVSNHD
jgi:hypothetical protein